MKKSLYTLILVILICIACVVLASCNGIALKRKHVLAINSDLIIYLDDNGTINTVGEGAGLELNNWNNISSLCSNGYTIVGLNNDGTVVTHNLLSNNLNDLHLDKWENIVMIESAYLCPIFGLNKYGNVLVDAKDDSHWSDIVKEVKNWEDIVDIDVSSSGIVGINKNGRAYCSTLIKDQFKEVDEWRDIEQVCISFDMVVGLANNGQVYATNWREDYMEPFSDLVGANKICLGSSFVVGLMPDKTLKIRSLTFDMPEHMEGRVDDKIIGDLDSVYSNEELLAIYNYQQDIMNEDLKNINNETDIIDVDVAGDFLVVLKKDGIVLVVDISE